MSGNLGRAVFALETKDDDFVKGLASAEGKAKAFVKGVKSLFDNITFDTTKLDDLTEKLDLIAKTATYGLPQVSNAFKDIKSAVSDTNSEVTKAKNDISKLDDAFKSTATKATGSIKEVKAELNNSGIAASVAGKAMGAGLTLGLKAADLLREKLTEVVTLFNESSSATGQFQAKLGLTRDEASRLGNIGKEVFKDGWGESIKDVNEALAITKQQFSAIDDGSLKDLTKQALILQQTFGMEVTESMKVASTMARNFGVSGKEAFDLITVASQKGGDKAGDLLDTFNEYSVQFKSMGYSASEFSNILVGGLRDGAFNADKVADAVKEFNIRIRDGSKTTNDALSGLGFNVQDFTSKLADGSMSGKEALNKVNTALRGLSNDVQRNQLGVALYGSQWEDMGQQVVLSLDSTQDLLGNVDGATKKAGDALSDNLGSKFETMKREALLALEPIANNILDLAINSFPTLQQAFNTAMDFLQPAFNWLGTNVPIILGNIGDFIQNTVIPALNNFATFVSNDLIPRITDFANFIAANVGPILQTMGDIITTKILPTLGDMVNIITNNVLPVISSWVSILGTMLAPVFQFIAGVIQNAVLPAINWLWGVIQNNLLPAFTTVANFVQTNVMPALQTLANILSGALKVGFEVIGTVAGAVWTGISTAVSTAWGILSGIFNGISSTIGGTLSGAFSAFSSLVGVVWNGVSSAISLAWSTISGIFNIITGFLSGTLGPAFNTLKTVVETAWNGIKSVIDTVASGIKTTWDGIKSAAETVLTPAIKTVETVFKSVGDGIKSALDTVMSVWNNVVATIQKGGEALGKLLKGDLTGAWESLTKSSQTSATSIGQAATDMANKFGAEVSTLSSKTTTAMSEVSAAVSSQDFSGEAQAVGVSIGTGMQAGMQAMMGSVAATAASIARNALAAAKSELDSHSPSRKFAEVGKSIPDGMTLGILNNAKSVMDAMGTMLGGVTQEALDAAVKQAESLSKISDTVGKIGNALNSIRDYVQVGRGPIEEFSADTFALAANFYNASKNFTEEMLKGTDTYSDSVNKVSQAAMGAFGALSNLPGYAAVGKDIIYVFGQDVLSLTAEFYNNSKIFDTDMLTSVNAYSESVQKVMGGVQIAFSALSQLSDYEQVAEGHLTNFARDLNTLIELMVESSGWFDIKTIEATATWAGAIQKMVGMIGPAVNALTSLTDYKQIAEDNMLAFIRDLNALIEVAVESSQWFSEETITATAIWSESIGKLVSMLGPAVSGLTALNTYSKIAEDNMLAFIRDLNSLVELAVESAGWFDAKAVTAAAVWGESVGKLTTGLKTSMELFTALQTYKSVASNTIKAFIADVNLTVQLASEMAAKVESELLAQINLFGSAIGSLFNGLKSAMDLFKSLEQFKSTPSTVIQQFINEVIFTVQLAAEMAQRTDKDLLKQAVDFYGSVSQIFNNLKSAMDAFKQLENYKDNSVNAVKGLLEGINNAIALMPQAITKARTFSDLAVQFKNNIDSGATAISEAAASAASAASAAAQAAADSTKSNAKPNAGNNKAASSAALSAGISFSPNSVSNSSVVNNYYYILSLEEAPKEAQETFAQLRLRSL